MKNLVNHFIFISVMFSFLMIGCEQKTELLKTTPNDSEQITNRYVDECGDCPNMDDCCGRILFVSGTSIKFETCGTTDGDAAACSGDIDGCEEIDGLKNSEVKLDLIDPIRLLCMEENHSFYIRVTDVVGTVVLNITFQHGQTSPQSINITITSTGLYAFTVDGDCVVSQCP